MSVRRRHRGRGFSVALIGPDGAGKTTIARQLPDRLHLPMTYVYMGVAAESSNHLLPTTRLKERLKRRRARPPASRTSTAPVEATTSADVATSAGPGVRPARPARGRGRRSMAGRLVAPVVGALKLADRLAEEWYRQAIVWRAVRTGRVVVLDRHFTLDFHAADVRDPDRTLRRRIHGWLLTHAYPRPDLVLYLDAPAAVLLARKGEGTLESLERRRVEYLEAGALVPDFQVVDATRSLETVAADVAGRVAAFADDRRGWSTETGQDEPAVP